MTLLQRLRNRPYMWESRWEIGGYFVDKRDTDSVRYMVRAFGLKCKVNYRPDKPTDILWSRRQWSAGEYELIEKSAHICSLGRPES